MAMLDVVPDTVDIRAYAGDTLTIRVTAPDALVGGLDWLAQVRTTDTDTTVAATFDITPPAVPDGPAYLVLPAATTRLLAGTLGRELPTTRSIIRFTGVWDVQVSDAGSDPVTTLARGQLTIDMDVSRLP